MFAISAQAKLPEVVFTPKGQVLVVYDYSTGQVKAIIPVSKSKDTK